jgi:hypothetical protein
VRILQLYEVDSCAVQGVEIFRQGSEAIKLVLHFTAQSHRSRFSEVLQCVSVHLPPINVLLITLYLDKLMSIKFSV